MNIVKRIKFLFLEITYPAKFAKSIQLESFGRYAEALLLLKKYDSVVKNNVASNLDYYLIRSRLFHRMKDYENALLDSVLVEKNIKDFNDDDINNVYLKKYVYFILSKIYFSLGSSLHDKYHKLYKQINYENNNNVLNSSYEYWFPLPEEAYEGKHRA